MKAFKFIVAICAVMSLTISLPAASQTINVKTPGDLAAQVMARYGTFDINDLIVRGALDDRDLLMIRRMLFLSYLDISQTNLKSLPYSAFASMRNLENVRLPSDLKRIGRSAFEGCLLIISLHIPSGVTEIGANAFYNCTALAKIEIPTSVEKIGNEAFMSCLSQGDVIIGGTPIIGERAFAGCVGLKTVICLSPTPADVSLSAFEGTDPQKQLGVPVGAVEAYRAHPVWGKLFSQILPATEK